MPGCKAKGSPSTFFMPILMACIAFCSVHVSAALPNGDQDVTSKMNPPAAFVPGFTFTDVPSNGCDYITLFIQFGIAFNCPVTSEKEYTVAANPATLSMFDLTGLNVVINPLSPFIGVTTEITGTKLDGTTVTTSFITTNTTSTKPDFSSFTGIKSFNIKYSGDLSEDIIFDSYTIANAVALPTVTTTPASAVGVLAATLNGTVTANGASTTAIFDYGTSTSYGTTVAASPSSVTGSNVSVSAVLSGLTCNTTYHYRVRGVNPAGTTNGLDQNFKTSACPAPTATTTPATAITATTATLNGTVNANGFYTTVSFDYASEYDFYAYNMYTRSFTDNTLFASGYSNVSLSAARTGLTCNTTYHYRIVGSSNNGTSYGADQTLLTLPCLPTIDFAPTDHITQTSVSLNAEVSSNGAPTTVTFEYGLTKSYGTQAVVASPVSGSRVKTTLAISNLTCGTTYYYRAKGDNSAGTTYGGEYYFTTAFCPPIAITNAASDISMYGATLNGTISTFGYGSKPSFLIGKTTAYEIGEVNATQSGISGTNISVDEFSLSYECNTTYHYKVKATSDYGITLGSDQTFLTSPCTPDVQTNPATEITSNSATINATLVNPNGAASKVSFEFNRLAVVAEQSYSNNSNSPFSAKVTGLTCNTTYSYTAIGTNVSGTKNAPSSQSFTTLPCAPTITNVKITTINRTEVVFNGVEDANKQLTSVSIEYGTDIIYGTTHPATVTSSVVNATLSGLTCGTNYHYRLTGGNLLGTSVGADQTFTTLPCPPTVSTGTVSDIYGTNATLHATVNANGGTANVYFEFGTTSAYDKDTKASNTTVTGTSNTDVPVAISKLACNTAYHYRAVIDDNGTLIEGLDQIFMTTTCSKPEVTGTVINITATSATLTGTVTSNGAFTNAGFSFSWFLRDAQGNGTVQKSKGFPIIASINAVNQTMSTQLTDLTCSDIFMYNAFAYNAAGYAEYIRDSFRTLPCSPIIGTATAGTKDATVSFTTPTMVGGFKIIGYTVTSIPAGGVDADAGTTALTHTITGLTPGIPYTFTVTANNSYDESPASEASNAVTILKNQSITFAKLSDVVVGSPDFDLEATSDASLAVEYVSSNLAVATINQGVVHIVGAGTTTITATQPGNATYAAATPVSRDLTVTKKTSANLIPNAPVVTNQNIRWFDLLGRLH